MTPSTDVALALFIDYYDGEINKELERVEFRRSAKIEFTDKMVNETNEKLYKLIMYRKNIVDIINNR